MSEGKDYFQQALSDFMFEVSSGGSIRHLADMGYSVEQIQSRLAFPTPRERVERAVRRHLTEAGILLETLALPEEAFHVSVLRARHADQISARFRKLLEQEGEEGAYLECPFGRLAGQEPEKLERLLSCLNSREREYLDGIRWERPVLYHRLNSRMREIAVKLVLEGELRIRCFFLGSRELLLVEKAEAS